MRIVFFGTPEFAAEVLEYLYRQSVAIVAVVTKPDRARGRSDKLVPPEVKKRVTSIAPHIPVFQPNRASTDRFIESLRLLDADLFVVVAYGEILSQAVLNLPKLGCINLHASLLPKYRGAAPIQHALLNGEEKTGVSVMHMVQKMDAGDVIQQVEVPIGRMNCNELEKALCDVGKKALCDVIHQFEKGTVIEVPQDESKVSYASKITLSMCKIEWTLPAERVDQRIRAFSPDPGAWTEILVHDTPKKLKILQAEVVEGSGSLSPGQLKISSKGEVFVGCSEGTLSLLKVHLEGKKPMSASDLFRGLHAVCSIKL